VDDKVQVLFIFASAYVAATYANSSATTYIAPNILIRESFQSWKFVSDWFNGSWGEMRRQQSKSRGRTVKQSSLEITIGNAKSTTIRLLSKS